MVVPGGIHWIMPKMKQIQPVLMLATALVRLPIQSTDMLALLLT